MYIQNIFYIYTHTCYTPLNPLAVFFLKLLDRLYIPFLSLPPPIPPS